MQGILGEVQKLQIANTTSPSEWSDAIIIPKTGSGANMVVFLKMPSEMEVAPGAISRMDQ